MLNIFKKKISESENQNIALFMSEIEASLKWLIASWSWDKAPRYEQLSIIFVAGSGKGKSFIMMLFNKLRYECNIYWIQEDFTTIDVYAIIYKFIEKGYKIMAVPEMNRLCNHTRAATKALFAVLLNMLEMKGLYHVKTSTGMEAELNPPIKLSLIGGLTPEVFNKNFKDWFEMGLLTRPLIFSFTLSDEQERKIINHYNRLINIAIKEGKSEKLKYKMTNVKVDDFSILEPLNELASEINRIIYHKYVVMSKLTTRTRKKKDETEEEKNERERQKQFILELKNKEKPSMVKFQQKLLMLCMGKVISEGRDKLTSEDVKEVIRVVGKYANFNYNEVN